MGNNWFMKHVNMRDVAAEILDYDTTKGRYRVRWWNVSRSGTEPWPIPGRPLFAEETIIVGWPDLIYWEFTKDIKEFQR